MSLKKVPNHNHAWKSAWNRPMKMDEDELHAFTIARMTDHNVRGPDPESDMFAKSALENEGGIAPPFWEKEDGL